VALNEADTRAKLIDPALHQRGWTEDLIRREETAGSLVLVYGKACKQGKGRIGYSDAPGNKDGRRVALTGKDTGANIQARGWRQPGLSQTALWGRAAEAVTHRNRREAAPGWPLSRLSH
jgi:hypothetical protein